MKPRIMPPSVLCILLLLQIACHFLIPGKILLVFPFNMLGILFILTGIIIILWADNIFKKVGTTVKPGEDSTHLVTEGPFRISRHPMYLGIFMILLGAALSMGSVTTFIFPVIFVVIIQIYFIPLEEKNMERIFKDEYLQYKKKVRTWI